MFAPTRRSPKVKHGPVNSSLSSIRSYRTAPIGLAIYGPDLRYLRVNEQLAKINGLSADKHPGLMTRDVNPDVAKAVELYLRRVFSRGESIFNVEIQSTTQTQAGGATHLAGQFPSASRS